MILTKMSMPLPIIKWPVKSVYTLFIGIAIIICVFAITIYVTEVIQTKKTPLEKPRPDAEPKGLFFLGLGIIVLALSGNWFFVSHGMYDNSIPLEKAIEYSLKTPQEDSLNVNGDLTGKSIIYFRFDCPDCHATYQDIQNAIDSAEGDFYWISTRSEQGKALLEEYPVMEVPALVHIKNDHIWSWLPLSKKTESDEIIFDELNFQIMCEYIKSSD